MHLADRTTLPNPNPNPNPATQVIHQAASLAVLPVVAALMTGEWTGVGLTRTVASAMMELKTMYVCGYLPLVTKHRATAAFGSPAPRRVNPILSF
jgi:hypothetical protein